MKGFRRVEDQYEPIELVNGRMPSLITGLHLEPVVEDIRLVNPLTGQHLTILRELPVLYDRKVREVEAAQLENERLRRELEELRRRLPEER